jgi:hypothetical protein
MAIYKKYYNFTEQLGLKTMNLNVDVFKIALTNTPPTQSDITFSVSCPPPAAAFGYAPADIGATWSEASPGIGTMVAGNSVIVFTAEAGGIGPFQYVSLYNSDALVTTNNLVAYWEHTAEINLAVTETFTVTFSGAGAVVFTNE